jgi:hypothetical protein
MRIKKVALVTGALALVLLAGCAHHKGTRAYVPSLELRSTPQVEVRDGKIVVPNSLVYFKGETDVTIRWQLPSSSSQRFPENGITIDGIITDKVIREGNRIIGVVIDPNQQEIVDCKRAKDGLEFTCLNRNTKPGIYKYTIRVQDGDKLLVLDPGVDNGPW